MGEPPNVILDLATKDANSYEAACNSCWEKTTHTKLNAANPSGESTCFVCDMTVKREDFVAVYPIVKIFVAQQISYVQHIKNDCRLSDASCGAMFCTHACTKENFEEHRANCVSFQLNDAMRSFDKRITHTETLKPKLKIIDQHHRVLNVKIETLDA